MEPVICQSLPFYCLYRSESLDDGQNPSLEAAPAEASPAEGLPPHNNFILLYDPSSDPLGVHMELCLWEVRYGLTSGSFVPGTQLYDQKSGLTHTVRRAGGRDILEPRCERLARSARGDI